MPENISSAEPVSYPKAVDARSEFQLLQRNLSQESQAEFKDVLANFRSYVFNKEGSWSLDAVLIRFIDSVLNESRDSKNKIRLLRLLATCSVRPDFQVLLSNDRKKMVLLNYAARISVLPADEQTAISLLLCNISSQHLGRSWLLYISKWPTSLADDAETCNAEISTAVARNSVQSYNPALKKYGVGLIFNLSLKDVEGYREIEKNSIVSTHALEGSVLKANQQVTRELKAVLAALLEKTNLDEEARILCQAAMDKFSQHQNRCAAEAAANAAI
jgi:hypothetical protein